MDKNKFNDKWLYLPILILGTYLIIRLIDQSNIIYIFPLDKYNDWSSYMAQLHFLKVCGFHNFCPYWYNGFINFQINQPGFYFFIYPLYLLIKDIQLTFFLALILILLLSFLALYLNRDRLGISKTKSLAFFLLFFGNAISIGNFIRLGKIHQLFGWFNVIIIFIFLLVYKDKKIDKNFLFIMPFYFFSILSHQNLAIISTLTILGLFLIKDLRERIYISLILLVTWIASSFWWLDYIKNFPSTTSKTIIVGQTLSKISRATYSDNIVAILIPLAFFIIFYLYLRSSRNRKKELIFFSPILAIAILLLTRLILFIPFINQVFPDAYSLMLLFFMIYMFFKIDFNLFKKYKKIFIYGIALVSILSILLNIIFTPTFTKHTELEKDTIEILKKVESKFMVLNSPSRRTSYPEAYYSYASIYLNLSTPSGWYPSMASKEYVNKLSEPENYLESGDCLKLRKSLYDLKVKEVISYNDSCYTLYKCEFSQKANKNNVCLYEIK